MVVKVAWAYIQLERNVTGSDIALPALIEELGGDDQNAFRDFHGTSVYRAGTARDAPRAAGPAAHRNIVVALT